MPKPNLLGRLARRLRPPPAPEPVADVKAAAAVEPGPAPAPARFLLSDPSMLQLLAPVERALPTTAPADVPALLAAVPLDLFTLVATHRPDHLPRLSAWLPPMPDESVQRGFTGAAGEQVMLEAARFIAVAAAAATRAGLDLRTARALDYGVGWGRISRLLYRYVPAPQVHGVDAWPGSLEIARALQLHGPLALVDEAPARLPFDGPFDLVCAFSVFTHLGEAPLLAAVGAIRAGLRPGGLLVATVRPPAYWELVADGAAELATHAEHGFAFRPAAGRDAYGDATVSLDHVRRRWVGFELEAVEVNAADPYQLIVVLRAA